MFRIMAPALLLMVNQNSSVAAISRALQDLKKVLVEPLDFVGVVWQHERRVIYMYVNVTIFSSAGLYVFNVGQSVF